MPQNPILIIKAPILQPELQSQLFASRDISFLPTKPIRAFDRPSGFSKLCPIWRCIQRRCEVWPFETRFHNCLTHGFSLAKPLLNY